MNPRYLTKSRFKLALECPTKLSYTGRSDYADTSAGNSFLEALAEGGYQVGALACAMFPAGVEVTDRGHAAQLQSTRDLLRQDEITIFEAALEAEGLFVRVDILRKQGNRIEIIEVKAKSYDPMADAGFRGARGQIKSGWLPYLNDVAFQCHVAELAMPSMDVHGFLMLADKSKYASVNGLNQLFPVHHDPSTYQKVSRPDTVDATRLGSAILTCVSADQAIREIQGGSLNVGDHTLPFSEGVAFLAEAYRMDRRLQSKPGSHCGNCQFKVSPQPGISGKRSGFHECWKSAFGWNDSDFAGGTLLDVWKLRKKDDLIARGALKPSSITLEDLEHDGEEPAAGGLSVKDRQWFQCRGEWPGGGDYYFDAEGMRTAMASWRYPLHFIDFETCTVAVPFTRGQRPYETVAFQFSHHVMDESGRVEHRTQFLDATPGVDPSISFVRALRNALSGDEGTILRWASHENTVLNQLRARLIADPVPTADAGDLISFIESITSRAAEHGKAMGKRHMVDLCKLAELHFFHPSTKGSCSLKKVLPALMASSEFLRTQYSSPVYGSASMPSLNLSQPMRWWQETTSGIADPYDLLPPLFADEADVADVADVADENTKHKPVDRLQDGGSAMSAYARLQFESLDPALRRAMEEALLRYCELDTLAMVMAVQAWQQWQVGIARPVPDLTTGHTS